MNRYILTMSVDAEDALDARDRFTARLNAQDKETLGIIGVSFYMSELKHPTPDSVCYAIVEAAQAFGNREAMTYSLSYVQPVTIQ